MAGIYNPYGYSPNGLGWGFGRLSISQATRVRPRPCLGILHVPISFAYVCADHARVVHGGHFGRELWYNTRKEFKEILKEQQAADSR